MTAEELYGVFGKYGAVYQIRLGEKHKDTRGTAFVVYEDIYDAKAAVDHLSGFNVGGKLFLSCTLGRIGTHRQIMFFLGSVNYHLLTFFFLTKQNRTIFGCFVLPTRKVPTPSRGGRKTKRIRGIEAEGTKEKGSNGGKGRKLVANDKGK